ncbi:MAG: peptidylprolyl isomerase [Desulfosudaceae bacterium]
MALLILMVCIGPVGISVAAGTAEEAAAETEVVDRIVAIVNQDIVTLSEIRELMKPIKKKITKRNLSPRVEEKMLYRAREDLINEKIDELLTAQKAEKLGIRVSEEEVDAALERIKQNMMYSDEQLRNSLEEMGISMETYREQMKNQIRRTRVLSREVESKIVITREDVRRYYDEHRQEFASSTRYHLKNIIIQPSDTDTPGSRQAVFEEMKTIREKIKSEEATFEEMARQHSQSSFADKGGDLGMFELEDLSPQLRQAIEETPVGGITPVLESDVGFQIFYVADIVDNPGQSLEEASEEIRKTIYEKKMNDKFEEWVTALREDSHIKIIR